MPNDAGAMTWLLKAFMDVLSGGYERIVNEAWYLLYVFSVIEIVLCGLWYAAGKEDILVHGVGKILTIGFTFFLITSWPYFLIPIQESLIKIGILVGGGTIDIAMLSDPSLIADYGMKVCEPIIKSTEGMTHFQIGDTILYGLVFIGILCLFYFVAIQVFLAYVEFYIVSIFGLIIIPLYVFQHTKFLAESTLKTILAMMMRLGILATVISIAIPLMEKLELPTDPTIAQCMSMLLAIATLAALSMSAAHIGSSLVSGLPHSTGAGAILGLAGGTVMAFTRIAQTPTVSSAFNKISAGTKANLKGTGGGKE